MNARFDPARATFAAENPAGVDESLRAYGCALIKGLLEPAELARFDDRISHNLRAIAQDAEAIGAGAHYKSGGFPLYFAGADSTDRIRAAFRRGYPALFDPRRMDRNLDCESLPRYVFGRMTSTGLERAVSKYLGVMRLATAPGVCHIRAFDAPAAGEIEDYEAGAEFHQDNRLYRIKREILTLWFPFRYEHGKMASLEFLPRNEKTLLPCKSADSCGIERNSFPQEQFWSPAYELGDAVLISGYSPHRTYYPRGVSLERTSIDMRFFPRLMRRAIYARPLWRTFF